MAEQLIGKITHFFPKIGVAVINLTGTLRVGNRMHVKGATTDFTQEVDSMQISHQNVDEAKAGESIGMKVDEPVRAGDSVFLVEADE